MFPRINVRTATEVGTGLLMFGLLAAGFRSEAKKRHQSQNLGVFSEQHLGSVKPAEKNQVSFSLPNG